MDSRSAAWPPATLTGSAALTLVVGFIAHRFRLRQLLVTAALLMVATGVCFAVVREFWPLVLVAFFGTLSPSSGDVSGFLPLERSLLPQTVSDQQRTALFARYSPCAIRTSWPWFRGKSGPRPRASRRFRAALPRLPAHRCRVTCWRCRRSAGRSLPRARSRPFTTCCCCWSCAQRSVRQRK